MPCESPIQKNLKPEAKGLDEVKEYVLLSTQCFVKDYQLSIFLNQKIYINIQFPGFLKKHSNNNGPKFMYSISEAEDE